MYKFLRFIKSKVFLKFNCRYTLIEFNINNTNKHQLLTINIKPSFKQTIFYNSNKNVDFKLREHQICIYKS